MVKPIYKNSEELEKIVDKFELRPVITNLVSNLFVDKCPRYIIKKEMIPIQLCEVCSYNQGFLRGGISLHPGYSVCTRQDRGKKIELRKW